MQHQLWKKSGSHTESSRKMRVKKYNVSDLSPTMLVAAWSQLSSTCITGFTQLDSANNNKQP